MITSSFMQRCVALAHRGAGFVAPNPMVGAVLVVDGEIISEGYHRVFGGPHAEVEAIQNLKDRSLLSKATLYVSLEPCCHHGKTPPCTDLIIRSGIRRVVVGIEDPNPLVAGKGILQLRNAGVEVLESELAEECGDLNRRFFTYVQRKRPYVILKWAQTVDGFIARSDGSSKWISSLESRTLSHRWRAEESAIVVGTRTALVDDPELTVRHVVGSNPLRVLIDRDLKVPQDAKILNSQAKTLVLNERRSGIEGTIEYLMIDFGKDICEATLQALYHRKILSVMIEGGAKTIRAYVERALWDEARQFISNERFESGIAIAKFPAQQVSEKRIGSDLLKIVRRLQGS